MEGVGKCWGVGGRCGKMCWGCGKCIGEEEGAGSVGIGEGKLWGEVCLVWGKCVGVLVEVKG